MWTRLWREIAADHVFAGVPPLEWATRAELGGLPPAAQAYMGFFGVREGTPKRWSFRLGWTGRFRLGPERAWMPVGAVQYNLREPVARVFHMKARLGHVVPVLARDTYVDGEGHMLAKLGGLITVADGSGGEYDEGELATWLNDAVLFAPTMLLGPRTRWSHVDGYTFDVTFSDRDYSVCARVTVDDAGAPRDFLTTNRYLNDPADRHHPLIRASWHTPIPAWHTVGGLRVPVGAQAVWQLDQGDFSYAELEVLSLVYDVPPGDESRSSMGARYRAHKSAAASHSDAAVASAPK